MISKEQVQQVAKLARLEFGAKEVAKMQKELSSILDYLKLLEEVDISQIAPTSHSMPIENIMRKDEAKPESPETVNKILDQAPMKEKGHIRVKGVLN